MTEQTQDTGSPGRKPAPAPLSEGVTAESGGEDPAAALYACGFSVRTIADATDRGVKAVRAALIRADVTLRPPGAVRHPNGAEIAALPPGPAADIATALLAREAEARAAARFWDPADGPDAWESVLGDAVAAAGSIAVTEAATRKLGRRPTRLEAAAALRAAHRLNARSELNLQRLRSPDGGRQQWVISTSASNSRTDHPADEFHLPAGTASSKPVVVADQLIEDLRQVQATTRLLEPEHLPRDAAQRLAAVIEATQPELDALHTRLDSA